MKVGERLRELREAVGLSQAALGRELAMSRATISSYETGKHQIDADELPRLASILGVTATAFFDEQLDAERVQARTLFEQFLAWQSATLGSEGSHSLVLSAPSSIPPAFATAFPTSLDPTGPVLAAA